MRKKPKSGNPEASQAGPHLHALESSVTESTLKLTPMELQLIRDFRQIDRDTKKLHAMAIIGSLATRLFSEKPITRPALRLVAGGAA